ncbi:hypothetical protein Sste5346_000268 [Sporothrix stenoceras]|uniref:XRCC4 coiled-coil domain-containing protein n=1 Tax=Sporothrix stenoceras TaxID=5173 RepID=A0ABR3ZT54_9PEZI
MADQQASHVVRIPRSDEVGSFVLARVSPSGPASRPLNARLVATEGEAPYVLSLRHDRIDKLRGQNAPVSPEEWEQILLFLLLGQGSIENVDATATVKEEATLTITVRKRVQNITQRLGTLSLTYDGDEGIELFEWCGEAVDAGTKAAKELVTATKEQSNLQAAVDDLKAQLDDFLETKDADEAALLEKFCLLLNEKKLKIRQQYRQITKADQEDAEAAKLAEAEAEIKEEEDLEEEEPALAAPASTRSKQGTARSRLGKVGRGAATTAAKAKPGVKRRAAAAVSEDEDSDEFEKPPAAATRGSTRGKGKEAAAEAEADSDTQSEEDGRTTENDDESTESEQEPEPMDEDVEIKEEEESPKATKATKSGKGKGKGKGKAAPKKSEPEKPPTQDEAPPPRRTLAFGKARAPAAAAAPPPASSSKDHNMDGSDSESDDEL